MSRKDIPSIRVTIDVEATSDGKYTVNLKCRPLIPLLDLADLLEGTVSEIRQGRLDYLTITGPGE